MYNLQTIIFLSVAAVNFLIGAYAFLHNVRSAIHRSFFLFTTGASVWSASILLIFSTGSLFFNDIIFYGGILMFGSLWFFANVFPHGRMPRRRFWASLLPLGGAALAVPFGIFVKGIEKSGDSITPITGPGLPFFAAVIVLYGLASLFLFIRNYRRTRGLARHQMQYLFLGVSVFIGSVVLFDTVLPAFKIFTLNVIGPATSIFFVGSVAYAIVRYQLLNIRVILRYGLLFSLLTTCITALFIFSTTLLSHVFSGISVFLVPSMLLALTVRPIESSLARVTDRLLFQEPHDLETTLHQVTEILTSTIHLDQLLPSFLQGVTKPFHVENAALVLFVEKDHYVTRQAFGLHEVPLIEKGSTLVRYLSRNQSDVLQLLPSGVAFSAAHTNQADDRGTALAELKKLGFRVAVPLPSKNHLVAILFLGEKRTEELFSSRELFLLLGIAHQAAVVIDNARLYEEERAFLARLKITDQIKSEFVAVASHQFRTPLSVISWNVDLLQDVLRDHHVEEAASEHLLAIRHSTQFLLNTLENLFLTLLIEEGRLSFEMQPVQLWEVLEKVVNDHTGYAHSRKIQFNFEKSTVPVKEIQADPAKLYQVLSGIVQNAIEYQLTGKPGKVELSVREVQEQEKKGLSITVEDSGIGISEKDAPHIFDKFFRSEEAKIISPNGAGVSLYIAQKVLAAHGGSLAVSSQLGKGTTVSVFLPFLPPADRVVAKEQSPERTFSQQE